MLLLCLPFCDIITSNQSMVERYLTMIIHHSQQQQANKRHKEQFESPVNEHDDKCFIYIINDIIIIVTLHHNAILLPFSQY